jgi:hypothetical protein
MFVQLIVYEFFCLCHSTSFFRRTQVWGMEYRVMSVIVMCWITMSVQYNTKTWKKKEKKTAGK